MTANPELVKIESNPRVPKPKQASEIGLSQVLEVEATYILEM